jgi:hypothetical protein
VSDHLHHQLMVNVIEKAFNVKVYCPIKPLAINPALFNGIVCTFSWSVTK